MLSPSVFKILLINRERYCIGTYGENVNSHKYADMLRETSMK